MNLGNFFSQIFSFKRSHKYLLITSIEVNSMEESQRKERKVAKRLIKLAKLNSKWYTKEDVTYAKLIRRNIKHNANL